MSLGDPLPTIPIPSRERQVDAAVTEAVGAVGIAMMFELGGVKEFGQAFVEQRDVIRTNFDGATRRALQRCKVLDAEGNVIPGQERHAKRYGFGKER